MMKTKYSILAILATLCCTLHAQSLEDQLSNTIDIIVDINGNGDFTSVQEAVKAVPDNSSSTTVIFIRNGTYKEKVEIPSSKGNLTMIGEHIDKTVISYDDYSGSGEIYQGILNYKGQEIGTSTSHTLYAGPEDFLLMNLTVENTAGPVGQAVAVNLHGDRQTIAFCRILGNQDTFYTWGDGRFYITNSYIEGNVDFIFGRGAAYFENCLIVSNRSNSHITAASTDENWQFGYVFNQCILDGLPGVSGVTMGRPWKPYCQVVFMNSELRGHIKEEGWSIWNGNNNHETAFYAVYNNNGPGSNAASYPDWTHILSETEASEYHKENIFSKNVRPNPFNSDWSTNLTENEMYHEVEQTTTNIFEDTLYYLPLIEKVFYKGKQVEDYDPAFSLYSVTIHEEEVDESAIEVQTMDPEATVAIQLPNSIPGNATIKVTARSGSTSNYLLKLWYEPLSIDPDEKTVTAFPNPFVDKIQWNFDPVKEKRAQLRLYTLSGKQLVKKTISPDQLNSGTYILDTSMLCDGIYVYQFELYDKIIRGKLVKK